MLKQKSINRVVSLALIGLLCGLFDLRATSVDLCPYKSQHFQLFKTIIVHTKVIQVKWWLMVSVVYTDTVGRHSRCVSVCVVFLRQDGKLFN